MIELAFAGEGLDLTQVGGSGQFHRPFWRDEQELLPTRGAGCAGR